MGPPFARIGSGTHPAPVSVARRAAPDPVRAFHVRTSGGARLDLSCGADGAEHAMRSIFRILGMIARYHRVQLVLAYGTVLGAAGAGLGIPWVLRTGIDRALDPSNESRGMDVFVSVGIALVLLGVVRGLFSWGQTYFAEGLSQKVAYRIRNDYYDKLQHLSFAFHDAQTTGSLMSRATADVEGVRMFVNIGAVRSTFIVAMTVGAGTAMLLLDVRLALVTLAFIPFLGFRAVYTSRRLRRMWMRVQ